MKEQDALEVIGYVIDRVRPSLQGVLAPKLFADRKPNLQGAEHTILLPVDGARNARRLFARICTEMGMPQQISFPRERGEIGCQISTIRPEQFDLPRHLGALWGIFIGSHERIALPEAMVLSVDDLLHDFENDAERQIFGDEGSLDRFEEGLGFDDRELEEEEISRNPYLEELRTLTTEIALQVSEQHNGLERGICSWTQASQTSDNLAHTVVVHGFDGCYRATQLAKKVVEAVGRINSVALIDLHAPNVTHSDLWMPRYAVKFAENTIGGAQ